MPVASLRDVLLHFAVLNRAGPGRSNADVVLVHGLGANLRFWYYNLLPALAAINRVVFFDLRGHGLSSMPRTGYTAHVMAADLGALLDFLGIGEAHVVGHSFGGRVAISFAQQSPKRVKSLVLADVRLKSVQPKVTISRPFWPPQIPAAIRGADDNGEPAVAVLEALARFRLKIQGSQRASAIPRFSPFSGYAGRRNALRWLRLLDETTARDDICQSSDPSVDQLARVCTPTLLVYGECSPAMPTATALKQLWPHAQADIVSRAGHFFPIEHPGHLLASVGNFVRAHC
jgi:pimeloyl-ACP methyl ester carboxylesterase